jgi:endonuclease/exonuclease/phosphatase family metal-dependent hydrolase
VAARPLLPPEVGRAATDLHHGLLRSLLTGQANAVLLGPRLRLRDHRGVVLNPWQFRRREARRLGLGLVSRLAWGRERRVCQVVRAAGEEGKTLVVGNLHATTAADKRLADAELLRAATFVDGFAAPAEPVVLAGDFNLTTAGSDVLARLSRPEWGLGGAGQGIDHLLVRGARAGVASTWPEERRRIEGRVLSDHAPVDREIVV